MNSNRPYLLRALYEWIVDNRFTPHIIVDAERPGVLVPEGYVKDGEIVLNISPDAVRGLELGNELLSFNGRFSGRPTDVAVPMAAVKAIFARENHRGMVFPEEPGPGDDPSPPPEPRDPHGGGDRRPALKVVK